METDDAQGTAYCLECGVVAEENTIVAEVQFSEKTSGAVALQGSFVAAGQGTTVIINLN